MPIWSDGLAFGLLLPAGIEPMAGAEPTEGVGLLPGEGVLVMSEAPQLEQKLALVRFGVLQCGQVEAGILPLSYGTKVNKNPV